tara:strand:+ start:487 stop:669 length:183 start_codon:yes stop_codon:yes gene_type:complete
MKTIPKMLKILRDSSPKLINNYINNYSKQIYPVDKFSVRQENKQDCLAIKKWNKRSPSDW